MEDATMWGKDSLGFPGAAPLVPPPVSPPGTFVPQFPCFPSACSLLNFFEVNGYPSVPAQVRGRRQPGTGDSELPSRQKC